MEETYNLTAIILNRRNFLEDDGRVVVYSRERGKLELVVRGMKKIKSKLAGHLEPMTLSNIMAVRGRQYDYVGSAMSQNCYFNIKNDLDKLIAAGQAIKIFNKIIKTDQVDKKIFGLIKNFLDILEDSVKGAYDLLLWLFIFELLIELGHKPELFNCVSCEKKIMPGNIKFDLARGGLICEKCFTNIDRINQLTISENSVKLLRLTEKNDLEKLVKIKIDKKTGGEIKNIVSSFLNHQLF